MIIGENAFIEDLVSILLVLREKRSRFLAESV